MNGFQLSAPSGTTLEHNTATNNGGTAGIALGFSNDNTLRANHVAGNANNGIQLFASSGNRIEANSASTNGMGGLGFGVGIGLENSDNNTILENVADENLNFGILLSSDSSANLVEDNHTTGNDVGGRPLPCSEQRRR